MTALSDLDRTQLPTHLACAIRARDPIVEKLAGGIDTGWNQTTKYGRDTAPTMTKVPTTAYSWCARLMLHQRPTSASAPAHMAIFSVWRSADSSIYLGAYFDSATDRLVINHDGTTTAIQYTPPTGRYFELSGHWTGDEIVIDEDGEERARVSFATALGAAANRLDVLAISGTSAYDGHLSELWIDKGSDIGANRDRARDVLKYDAAADTNLWVGFRFGEGTGTSVADVTGSATLTLAGSPDWITPDADRWAYLSTAPLSVPIADLASDIRPTYTDLVNNPNESVTFLDVLDIAGQGFEEDIGGPQPPGEQPAEKSTFNPSYQLGGNSFNASAHQRRKTDQSGVAPVERYPLDRLARLRYQGGDIEVWRWAPAKADGTLFDWSDAEVEFTGKMAAEPGPEWAIRGASLLTMDAERGIVRETYRGSGAAVDFPNTNGAFNAYLQKTTPGVTGWPTSEYHFVCEYYSRDLPSERGPALGASLFEQWGGGTKYLTFYFNSSDVLVIEHDTSSAVLTTTHPMVKARLTRIAVRWLANEIFVYEEGVEKWRGAFSSALPTPAPATSLTLGAHNSTTGLDGYISECYLSNSGDEDLVLSRAAGPLDFASGVVASDLVYFWPTVSKTGVVIEEVQQADLTLTGTAAWVPVAGTPGPMEGEHPRQGGTGVAGATRQLASGINSNAPMTLMQSLDGALEYTSAVDGLGAQQLGQVRAQGSPVAVPVDDDNTFTATLGFQFLAAGAGSSPVNANDEIRYDDAGGGGPAARDFFARLVDRPDASRTQLTFSGTVSNNATYTVSKVISKLGDSQPIRFEVTTTPVSEGYVTATCVNAESPIGTMDVSESLFIPAAALTDPTADFRTLQVLPRLMLQQIRGLGLDTSTRLRDRTFDGTWPTDSLTFGTTAASGFFVPAGSDTPRRQLMVEQLMTMLGYLVETTAGFHTLKTWLPPDRDDASITLDERHISGNPRPIGKTPPIHEMAVTYKPNRHVQATGLVTGLDPRDSSYYGRPYETTAPKKATRTPASVSILWHTQLAIRSDAEELLHDYLWPFFTNFGGREWFEVPVGGPGNAYEPKMVAGGDTVILQHPRHRLSAGKPFVVQRVRSTRVDHRAVLVGFV